MPLKTKERCVYQEQGVRPAAAGPADEINRKLIALDHAFGAERLPSVLCSILKRCSLLQVVINYNIRNSLGIPDTSMMVEGNKTYVYKISKDNIANKTEIKIGIRNGGFIEVISGLNEGDNIVAEGLKKVRPRGKIKPIKK